MGNEDAADGHNATDGWRRAMVLHVEEHPRTGLVAVTSPDVLGLMTMEDTLAEALARVPDMVEELRAAAGPMPAGPPGTAPD